MMDTKQIKTSDSDESLLSPEEEERQQREADEARKAAEQALRDNVPAPDFTALEQSAAGPEDDMTLPDRLKDAVYYGLSRRDDKCLYRTVQLYKTAVQQHREQRLWLCQDAALLGCLSFREGLPSAGLLLGNVLVSGLYLAGSGTEDAPIRQALFAGLRSVLGMAARKRQPAAFLTLLGQLREYDRVRHPAAGDGYGMLLLDLLFMAADHRQLPALQIVVRLACRLWVYVPEGDSERRGFVREWTRTVAQFTHRGWDQEARILQYGLLRLVWQSRDASLEQDVLSDFLLQVQMTSQWSGVDKAFLLYVPVFRAASLRTRILVRRWRRTGAEEAVLALRKIFVCFRDMAAMTARVTMQDEWQVYTVWQQSWLATAGGRACRQRQICIFMQLLMHFWGLSQPRRARRQWKCLAPALEPRYVAGPDWEPLLLRLS
ncbi:MAG: hypothetical protein ACOYKB_06260 [Succiniclasticum sp.]|jgi:hypothetical protein